jgi:hypothetical protein
MIGSSRFSLEKLARTGLLVVAGMLSLVSPVLAAIEPITITPSIGFTSLSQAINTMLDFLFFFGALACFFYIVLGAFKYVTAGDNSNAVSSARTTVTNAIIGLILLAVVFVAFQVIVRIIPGLSDFFQIGSSGGGGGGGGAIVP